jgi:hypothetical protein
MTPGTHMISDSESVYESGNWNQTPRSIGPPDSESDNVVKNDRKKT